jgi:hypothetical protein
MDTFWRNRQPDLPMVDILPDTINTSFFHRRWARKRSILLSWSVEDASLGNPKWLVQGPQVRFSVGSELSSTIQKVIRCFLYTLFAISWYFFPLTCKNFTYLWGTMWCLYNELYNVQIQVSSAGILGRIKALVGAQIVAKGVWKVGRFC